MNTDLGVGNIRDVLHQIYSCVSRIPAQFPPFPITPGVDFPFTAACQVRGAGVGCTSGGRRPVFELPGDRLPCDLHEIRSCAVMNTSKSYAGGCPRNSGPVLSLQPFTRRGHVALSHGRSSLVSLLCKKDSVFLLLN